MAEKASVGDESFVYDSELKRVKLTCERNLSDSETGKRVGMDAYYSLPLGPMVASGMNVAMSSTTSLLLKQDVCLRSLFVLWHTFPGFVA